MPMIVHVKVTSEDIDKGMRRNNWSCPVALAMFRATGEKYSVGSAECHRIGLLGDILLPESVRVWINAFDDGLHPEPMEFDLEVEMGVSA